MKMKMSKPRSLLLLLPFMTLSFSLMAQDAMKDMSESFDVKQGITLDSDTRYADLELITWEQDVVDVVAEIEVDASSKSKAEEKLAKIDVKVAKSGNTISIETDFEEGWSRNAKVNIRIIVKAPAYLNLSLESHYGDVFLQEVNGLVIMDLKYGNLKAGTLGRGNEKPYNVLELDYSDGNIEKAGWLELDLGYSDLEISNSSMLFVESKYSKILGGTAGGIVAEGAYDKYAFDEVGSMVAELRYGGINLGVLKKKLSVESKYTHIKVADVGADFKEITASSSYGNIYLGGTGGASYKLDAECKYGKIDLNADGKLSKVKENSNVRVWGTVGSNPKSTINLEARYGNIVIE